MTDLPKLGHNDLQALLGGLPQSIRGEKYLQFLDRLEACGLRFERPGVMLTNSAPETSPNKHKSERRK